MDLLRAEIERKRRTIDLAKSSSSVSKVVAKGAGDEDGDHDGNGRSSTKTQTAGKKRKKYMNAAQLRRFQEEQDEREAAERERRRRRVEGGGGGVGRRRDGDGDGRGDGDGDDDDGGGRNSSPGGGGGGGKSGEGKSSEGGDGGGGEGFGKASVATGGDGGDAGGSAAVGDDAGDETAAAEKSGQKKGEVEGERQPPPEEITRALRSLGLPIRLFGERTLPLKTKTKRDKDGVKYKKVVSYDDAARWTRLREARELSIQHRTDSTVDEYALGGAYGIRNPFLDKNNGNNNRSGGGAMAAASGEKRKRDPAAAAADAENKDDAAVDADDADGDAEGEAGEEDAHKRIHRFFKTQLKNWESDLAARPDSVRKTVAGRNETKTVKQCRDYIRPLFRLLKRRQLEEGIMGHLSDIVEKCEAGEFVEAHDAYMMVAIGRAAWPIGVTMVGIHARSGRAKIESGNVAHVMNSELQRKYLTSVKRLMSYCQKKAEHVAPSKKVR